jgi:FtsZ-interacting cell division protein ZipA
LWRWPVCCLKFFTKIQCTSADCKTFVRKGTNKESISSATITNRFSKLCFFIDSNLDSFEVVDDGFSNHQDVKEECTIQKEAEVALPVCLQTTERCPSVVAQPQEIYQNSQQQSITPVAYHYQATEADFTIGDFQQTQNYLLPSTNAPPPVQQNQQTFQLSHNQHQPLLFNQPPPQQTQSQQLEGIFSLKVHLGRKK